MKNTEDKEIKKVKHPVETRIEKQEDRQRLIQQLLQLPEDRIAERFSDRALDREHLKVQLRNGTWTSPYEFDQLVQRTIGKFIQPYEPKYPQDFYKQMLRLTGKPVPEKVTEKPSVFAIYTNELIYMRFSKEILQVLQRMNPLVAGAAARKYKHFQLLTDDAQHKVDLYIDQAVMMMRKHSTWHEFRLEYAKTYGLSYQLKAEL